MKNENANKGIKSLVLRIRIEEEKWDKGVDQDKVEVRNTKNQHLFSVLLQLGLC